MSEKTSGPAMVPGEMPGQGPSVPHETAGPEPVIVEGPGRYRVYVAPDGGWVIARAVGICETCQACGCGEQAEPVPLPDFSKGQAHILQWLMRNADSSSVRKLRKAMGKRG